MMPKGKIIMFYIKPEKQWIKSFTSDWTDSFNFAIRDFLICINKDYSIKFEYSKQVLLDWEVETINDYKEIPVFRTFEFEENITEKEFNEFKLEFIKYCKKILEKVNFGDITVPKNLKDSEGEYIFEIGTDNDFELITY